MRPDSFYDSTSMKYEIVKARYTGDLAKNALALANAGQGYVVLEAGKDRGTNYCTVAFKRPMIGEFPIACQRVSGPELKKVIKIMESRMPQHG